MFKFVLFSERPVLASLLFPDRVKRQLLLTTLVTSQGRCKNMIAFVDKNLHILFEKEVRNRIECRSTTKKRNKKFRQPWVTFSSPKPRFFWLAPRIETSGQVQRHSGFEWLCKHNRSRPEPIRFVRLDSELVQSYEKSLNCGLPVLDLARGSTAVKWVRMLKDVRAKFF